ncbi:11046_t:CDS:1, partial [Paraglomus occultum]
GPPDGGAYRGKGTTTDEPSFPSATGKEPGRRYAYRITFNLTDSTVLKTCEKLQHNILITDLDQTIVSKA